MYLSHFKFTGQPFSQVTRSAGEFFVPYHQDVFGMLREKSRTPGIMALFSDDEALLAHFSSELLAHSSAAIGINAFPKLSASALLYKLNPKNPDAKNRLHAIDAALRQWHEAFPTCHTDGLVLSITAVQAMRDNSWEVLGMLLTRAQELALPLTILLTGTPDQEARLLQHTGLGAHVHTRHRLRTLTCRESLNYVAAHTTHQGAERSPFTPARIRRMHALTKGSVTQLNALAHLALLAAWTERASMPGTRHLRLAAGEVLPPRRTHKGLTVGLFACVLFAACGWHFSAPVMKALPFKLPVPARWVPHVNKPQVVVQPALEHEVVNHPDAMHQLYTMWGYDASAEEALCQNAGRVNLQCKEGNATLPALEKEGYPWVSELKTGDHLNYAVVARVGKNSLDLLMNNRTWQVSRNWFTQHATGHYTLLHRLTPEGKEAIDAASDSQDLGWIDDQLSLALNEPQTHAHAWTQTLANRTREFQKNMHLHVDGLPGEETLMQLMRVNHTTPAIVTPLTQGETH